MPGLRWTEEELAAYVAQRREQSAPPVVTHQPPVREAHAAVGRAGETHGWQVRLCVRLPWPPTLNHLYPTGRDGRRHLSKRGRQYHTAVAQAVLPYALTAPGLLPLLGRLRVEVDAHPGDKRRRDLDNLPKIMSDALVDAGVMLDDAQVDEVRLRRQAIQRGGCVVVCVSERSAA